MTRRRPRGKGRVMTAILTLRMTPAEMLRFRVAALNLKKKRSKIVRERIADLIGEPAVAEQGSGSTVEGEPLATKHMGNEETVSLLSVQASSTAS